MIAMWSVSFAIFDRCSLIWMPGTLVAIGLNGPPLACPGLRSKVSSCEGPPLIHSRMHERLRWGSGAAASASRPNQPDRDTPAKPRLQSRSQSRRLGVGCMGGLLSVVEHELRAVE